MSTDPGVTLQKNPKDVSSQYTNTLYSGDVSDHNLRGGAIMVRIIIKVKGLKGVFGHIYEKS